MLALVIFLMGNNSNLADMEGEGCQKSENLADIICERPVIVKHDAMFDISYALCSIQEIL